MRLTVEEAITSEMKRRVTVPYHSRDAARGTLLQILKDAGIGKEKLQDLLRLPAIFQSIKFTNICQQCRLRAG